MLDPVPPPAPLLAELDLVEWDARGPDAVAAAVRAADPLWVRTANFSTAALRVLRALPPDRLVLWKVEHWGEDAPRRLHRSAGVDADRYVAELLDLGHTVVPYAFSELNARMLRADVPALPDLELLPLAVRAEAPGRSRDGARAELGVGRDELLVGAGGLFTAGKGFDELVVGFLRGALGADAHLVMSMVLDTDHLGPADLVRRWERLAGCPAPPRLHVRIGRYGGWAAMCELYRAVDAVLVTSTSDSWGRMVAEPVALGRPVVVRRARCTTNTLAPGLVLVDRIEALGGAGLRGAVELARGRAPALRRFAAAHHALPVVRERALALLRARTPAPLRARFDALAGDPSARGALDAALLH